MANPIDEQIILKIVAALEAITEVTEVYRPTTVEGYGRTPPGNYLITLISDDPIRNEEIDFAGNPPRIGWDQSLDMFLNFRPSDGSDVPIETTLRIFWANVIKKLLATPYWDDLALDTKVSAPSWFIDEGNGVVGISAVVTFQFRVQEDDPYSQ